MNVYFRIFATGVLLFNCSNSFSQTLPVGTPLFEEMLRRKQVQGEMDINTSFTIKPIYTRNNLLFDSIYNPSNYLAGTEIQQKRKKSAVKFLPVTINQQYNSHHPYGWNDGSMIPARGYQALITTGFYSKNGILSVQIQPEFVYAQNKNFKTFPSVYPDQLWYSYYNRVLNVIDAPEKFGSGSYTKVFGGQSSIRLNYKKLSLGVSTENLWWGPGTRNALIMSNNAPGFPHITFNTTAPLVSPIGSFEGQVISGFLKNSNILPPDTGRIYNGQRLYNPKNDDHRYLNGMIITWQPKWTKGLHFGFTRVFYLYRSDVESSLDGYLPIIGHFFKGKSANEDEKKRDQLLSVFFRLILPNDQAEVYGEFGRNDHSQNFDDLLQEPEHSRAYIIGGRKIFTAQKKTNIELFAEFTNLQLPTTLLVREQNIWYVHHQVRHGYTNRGQVMGAGIGPGGNSQTIGINWIKGIKRTGLMLERVVRNNDFYYDAFSSARNFRNHWVDLSVNLRKNWVYKRFVFDADLSWIRTLNYHWANINPGTPNYGKSNVSNLVLSVSTVYQF